MNLIKVNIPNQLYGVSHLINPKIRHNLTLYFTRFCLLCQREFKMVPMAFREVEKASSLMSRPQYGWFFMASLSYFPASPDASLSQKQPQIPKILLSF